MLKKIRHLDYPLLLIMLLFMVASTFVIFSATHGTKYDGYHLKNLVFYLAGFLVLLSIAFFDYRLLLQQSRYIYGIGILLLILVYFFGVTINGARSWFDLKIFNFQPAELVKIIIILSLARFLALREGQPLEFFKDLIPAVALVLLPFALVVKQPDLGNAIIYVIIAMGMMWIGNVELKHILIGLSVFALLFAVLIYLYFNDFQLFSKIIAEHQLQRIQTFLDPTKDPRGAGYQVLQSMTAIGSGQLFGEGFLQGSAVQKGFIPYPYSDSIFVVIGEEYGFVGTSMLILFYFLLIYRMVMIALQTNEVSGSYIIVGIISMFVFQVFENVGMMVGLMPLTGITLPFISYGGSSLLINMISIGFVMSIKIHQDKLTFL